MGTKNQARLPEKYRLAVVHCDLEGMTQAQAAGQLHWSERTIHQRLAEGRARLKRRLARRGLAPDGATLGAVLAREARAAVPAAWSEATARAALATVTHTMTIGVVSVAATQLTQEVFKVMLAQKLKLATATLLAAGLIAWGASAAFVSVGKETALRGAPAPLGSASKPAGDASVPEPTPARADTDGTFPVRGRVVDPDGKPVAGASVQVRQYDEIDAPSTSPAAGPQKGPAAVTDADGRFHFELETKGAGEVTSEGGPAWHLAKIAAAAPGFAPAWVEAGELIKTGEATLRLVRDDVPIHGRILDSQGRPVSGVVVRIRVLGAIKEGIDLDALLASGSLAENKVASWYGYHLLGPPREVERAPVWTGDRNAWTTGPDGRFEVHGVGRDRVARLSFHGAAVVADGTLDVMARATKTAPAAQPRAA